MDYVIARRSRTRTSGGRSESFGPDLAPTFAATWAEPRRRAALDAYALLRRMAIGLMASSGSWAGAKAHRVADSDASVGRPAPGAFRPPTRGQADQGQTASRRFIDPLQESSPRSGETSPGVRRWQRTSIGRAAPIAARARCARRRSVGCSRLLAQPQLASTRCAADFLPLSLRCALSASFGRSSRFRHGSLSIRCGRACRATSPGKGLRIPRAIRSRWNRSCRSILEQLGRGLGRAPWCTPARRKTPACRGVRVQRGRERGRFSFFWAAPIGLT